MNNPSLFVPAIVGDGEAETGPLATGWQSNKLINPRTDGIVLPILHLNGYKIANPTIRPASPTKSCTSSPRHGLPAVRVRRRLRR